MRTAVFPVEAAEFRLRFPDDFGVIGHSFFAFCQANRDVRIERTAQGEIIIMPPAGPETGRRNSSLTAQLYNWAVRDGSGIVFDSSTGFDLPNGATRSPDASWIRKSKLASLSVKNLWLTVEVFPLGAFAKSRPAIQGEVAAPGTSTFFAFNLIKNWPVTNRASPIKAAEKMLLSKEVSKPSAC
jgi:Putative restriction endonuclease